MPISSCFPRGCTPKLPSGHAHDIRVAFLDVLTNINCYAHKIGLALRAGGLLRKASVEEFYVLVFKSPKEVSCDHFNANNVEEGSEREHLRGVSSSSR